MDRLDKSYEQRLAAELDHARRDKISKEEAQLRHMQALEIEQLNRAQEVRAAELSFEGRSYEAAAIHENMRLYRESRPQSDYEKDMLKEQAASNIRSARAMDKLMRERDKDRTRGRDDGMER